MEDMERAQDDFVDQVFDVVEHRTRSQAALAQQRRHMSRLASMGGAVPPPPPAAKPAERQIREERGLVYITGRSQPIGKITLWGTQVSAHCRVHGGQCRRPYSFNTMPSGSVLHEWLAAGIDLTQEQHMALPKPMKEGHRAR